MLSHDAPHIAVKTFCQARGSRGDGGFCMQSALLGDKWCGSARGWWSRAIDCLSSTWNHASLGEAVSSHSSCVLIGGKDAYRDVSSHYQTSIGRSGARA